jgi:hypothetical protein
VKESAEIILAERDWVEDQIKRLGLFTDKLESGLVVTITFNLHLTVIDGKVLSILSEASSQQTCPICGAKPSQMNDLTNKFEPIGRDKMKYGISPLHAWIRSLEFLLHLAYRDVDNLRIWRVPGGDKNPTLLDRKHVIQDRMLEELALRVDFPKPGGAGNTNDGNTARTVFSLKNRTEVVSILNLEEGLIKDLHIILCVISSHLPIDPTKFGRFCRGVFERYVDKYKWFYLPVTIHKILVHGEEIVRSANLPLGMLSEQAGESRNKLWRSDREFHARKTSRQANLLDIFNRAMDSSDPIISNYSFVSRREMRKKLQLPAEAIELLLVPEIPEPIAPRQLEFGDEGDDDEVENEYDPLVDIAGNVFLIEEEIVDEQEEPVAVVD